MLRLDFTYDDLGLVQTVEKTRRASVSGVQEKVPTSSSSAGASASVRRKCAGC